MQSKRGWEHRLTELTITALSTLKAQVASAVIQKELGGNGILG